jgi:Nuclease-related domain
LPVTLASPVAPPASRANTYGMRFVTLSDHPGDRLAQARRQREAADAADRQHSQHVLAAARQAVQDARGRRNDFWSQRRLLSWLREVLTLRRLHRIPPPRPPSAREPDGDEEALAAGVRGEREVAGVLAGTLDQSWVLVKGYENPRGEIDCLLIGPGGLFAVEVKYVNGTFAITRDRWSYVQIDRYGIAHGPFELTDKGRRRRPPNVQLNEPLQSLEQFLEKFGHPVRFHPVVLLSHPKARIERRADGIGVQVLTDTSELLRLALRQGTVLDAAELSTVERLVIRDHEYHAARRRERAGGPPAG